MKARKILILLSALLPLLACSREETPAYKYGDTVRVSLNIFTQEMPSTGTRAEFALDPKVENPIADVWVLQYDELGQLCTAEHSVKTPTMRIPDHQVSLHVRPTSTIVVFANMGEIAEDSSYEWPATLTLLHESRFAADMSLDINGGADPARLFMMGETTLDASQITTPSTSINVMLSRLCCKLAVAVYQKANEFHDLHVQIVDAVRGFMVQPTEDRFTADYEDYVEDVSGNITSTRKYFYYYLYENLDPTRQTKIKVTVTGKDGNVRTRLFPISPEGSLQRNTFYNVDLEIKGSGGTI